MLALDCARLSSLPSLDMAKGKKRKLDPTAIQLAPDPKVRKVEIHHITANTRRVTQQVVSCRPAIPLPAPALATSALAADEEACHGDNEEEHELSKEPERKTVVSGLVIQMYGLVSY